MCSYKHESRLLYLDILKVLSMIMVLEIHFSYSGSGADYNNILSLSTLKQMVINLEDIAVPMFFMVNGSLLLVKGG